MSGIFVDRRFYSGSVPPSEPIDSNLIPCSGKIEPFHVVVGCSGNLDDLINNRYFEESPKIYGEEDKMKLVDDQSFWRRWWK